MKYLNEFIGTFFLVLTIGMSVLNPDGAGPLAPLAIGSALAVLVFAGANISGAHYNPAVSLAVFLRKKLSLNDLGFYWVAQLLGASVAAFLTIYFKGHGAETMLSLDPIKALIAEFLFSFALCHVVLNVATAKATNGNSYFGFAIGFTVLIAAYSIGAVSGSAINPAVALGFVFLQIVHWSSLWIFVVANLLGAALAAVVFKASHPGE